MVGSECYELLLKQRRCLSTSALPCCWLRPGVQGLTLRTGLAELGASPGKSLSAAVATFSQSPNLLSPVGPHLIISALRLHSPYFSKSQVVFLSHYIMEIPSYRRANVQYSAVSSSGFSASAEPGVLSIKVSQTSLCKDMLLELGDTLKCLKIAEGTGLWLSMVWTLLNASVTGLRTSLQMGHTLPLGLWFKMTLLAALLLFLTENNLMKGLFTGFGGKD